MPNKHTVVQRIRDYIADHNMMAVCNWSNVYNSYVVIYKSESINSWMLLRVNPSRKTYRIRYLKSADINDAYDPVYIINTNMGAINGIYTSKPQYFIEQAVCYLCQVYPACFWKPHQPSTTRKVVN